MYVNYITYISRTLNAHKIKVKTVNTKFDTLRYFTREKSHTNTPHTCVTRHTWVLGVKVHHVMPCLVSVRQKKTSTVSQTDPSRFLHDLCTHTRTHFGMHMFMFMLPMSMSMYDVARTHGFQQVCFPVASERGWNVLPHRTNQAFVGDFR